MKLKIRAPGREFWSAGQKWTPEGRVVTIVADPAVPSSMLRADGSLDLPRVDGEHQAWLKAVRASLEAKGELMTSDFEQVKADKAWLAIEIPDEVLKAAVPPAPPPPAPVAAKAAAQEASEEQDALPLLEHTPTEPAPVPAAPSGHSSGSARKRG